MSVRRWIAFISLLEAVGLSLYVACFIWRLQFSWRWSWVVIGVWMTASFLIHGDTPKTLGWRGDNLRPAMRQATIAFALLALAVCLAGVFLGALHRLPAHLLSFRRFWNYLAFCLLQQVALQSYLTNRLLTALPSRWRACLVAGAIFGALHWPNPVLVPITFAGGVVMSWLFARERNVLPLALGQAILGSLIWWAFPLAWHHSMRVGPGYYTFGH